ncbi:MULTISPECIES: helix-turn-helix transcriptional regulator [Pseudoalteromonas]|uniref:helix-turn-helix transcriptional regulator n=1 Tax=Pseudoalteromonas TaxID=53246 RepID=UPI00029AD91B|nr:MULTISPECIES: helix-turn-helix transcriptional regulator [Pseudoalteromonas]MBR8845488.1 helix-turn-helix transcriptional regulator [Pseudoalteromonas sp. JC3]MCX2766241.1 helix-turn-helix transcriptional regulator [Pseudoalteromonas sp. B530]UDM60172.1 helix-turn-helix transcriptional regulator [Pseudoalteromonas piscicida]WJE08697.1 helix-turn-helix transcriptional regulator [Pseudoalteromonas sp. JC3]
MFSQTVQLQPVNILQIVFTVVSVLGVILVWKMDRYRGVLFLFIYYSILMIFNLYEETRGQDGYIVTPIFTLIKGPIVYFLVRWIINEKPIASKLKFLHVAPAILALPFTQHVQLIILIATFSQITYLIASLKLIKRYHSISMAVRSDALSLKLDWVNKIIYVFFIFALVDLLRLNLQPFNAIEIKAGWYFIDVLVALLLMCFLVVKTAHQPELFDDMVPYEDLKVKVLECEQQSNLKLAQQLCEDITKVVLEKELYKKPRLSLIEVANETGFKLKDVSWSINFATGYNFCEFINNMRVNEVKKQIVLPQESHKSILEIAFDSGFNSKSVFYSTFKSTVGMTPSKYRSSQKQ